MDNSFTITLKKTLMSQTTFSPTNTPEAAPTKTKIAVAHGDGIGPEIMDATLKILEAAGAELDYEEVKIGKDVYLQGVKSGISPESWDTLRRCKVFLKSPITTPQGGGYKSLNVTIRKTLNLFANVRPSKTYHPFVDSPFPDMDLVIVRENEEDLYAGIEHYIGMRQDPRAVAESVMLITRYGSDRICRYAFEYARDIGAMDFMAITPYSFSSRTERTCFSNHSKLGSHTFNGIWHVSSSSPLFSRNSRKCRWVTGF